MLPTQLQYSTFPSQRPEKSVGHIN
ncbi:hypothetical protein CPAR01_12547 [Colletotrichum paranaense]|uniref:Uncharacterized protein n=4 Tax=Colletotrichum acutatum species complex TaxID=2707335 RepID=A0AAJ0DYB9_9PEZI|nr:hypothetical protein CSPX01_04738 [Colletotrichum filicis]KAK1463305.1 hypothetical protein CMEL01_13374 [Colletotrichum melonis]KAK1498496.1 hypothetical protein CTAM01_07225 [Colletotrichum tamarilloi]KAK1520491.1 hypothetical protein CCOS01_10610 [Colletotrichum costaricense]KAK1527989.1 hypothetical protein CPAR01_12547 [Colletotrichum paranaense]